MPLSRSLVLAAATLTVTGGVALAQPYDPPQLPAGTSFGVAGGVGYYNHRSAATASFGCSSAARWNSSWESAG